MSVHENAVVLRFADRATADQALSDLRHLAPATTDVRGAILVERLGDGRVRAPRRIGAEAGSDQPPAVHLLAEQVGPDARAIFAHVRETDSEALNLLAMEYDAVLERRPADSVRVELRAAQETADLLWGDEVTLRRQARVLALGQRFAA